MYFLPSHHAAWLYLFDVVDRRAKLVVGERPDEQSDLQPSVSNGQDFQTIKPKLKEKVQEKLNSFEPPKINVTEKEKDLIIIPSSVSNGTTNEIVMPALKNAPASDLDAQVNAEPLLESTTSKAEQPPNDLGACIAQKIETATDEITPEVALSSTMGHTPIEASNAQDGPQSPSLLAKASDSEFKKGEHLVGDEVPREKVPSNAEEVKIQKEVELSTNSQEKENINLPQEPEPVLSVSQVHDNTPFVARVQDQLDEAQGLLKIAVSTGQSKEARLARVCAGLSSRLQEYKSENAQLEELLIAEREQKTAFEAHVKQLQQELSIAKSAVTRVEKDMADALASKKSEIEGLLSSLDSLNKQAATSEGKLASLQANMDSMMRTRELSETRMIQALREDLASTERRAEQERAAHNATKKAFMEREVELEQRAVEASTALARTQRMVDERTQKAADLEHKLSLLEVECASLNQELQEVESRVKREQKKSPEEANQTIQMQAWREEAERARQGQRDAESKLFALEAEMQKMRVEMAGMKRDAEHYSRQEHMELEKRYRELTDLLYLKQTQLEAMASEKAAAEFQLEKEARRYQEAQVEAERSKALRRASTTTWDDEADLKVLEPLHLHHRQIAGASIQKAAKLLDSGAVSATRFLWRYPIARVIFLFYLVFVHIFLLYLLHRLQEQADNSTSSREVAASMGLLKPELP
ncbi:hypothetical protein AMTRI_Chr05g67340 [Amborella trichopoda]